MVAQYLYVIWEALLMALGLGQVKNNVLNVVYFFHAPLSLLTIVENFRTRNCIDGLVSENIRPP